MSVSTENPLQVLREVGKKIKSEDFFATTNLQQNPLFEAIVNPRGFRFDKDADEQIYEQTNFGKIGSAVETNTWEAAKQNLESVGERMSGSQSKSDALAISRLKNLLNENKKRPLAIGEDKPKDNMFGKHVSVTRKAIINARARAPNRYTFERQPVKGKKGPDATRPLHITQNPNVINNPANIMFDSRRVAEYNGPTVSFESLRDLFHGKISKVEDLGTTSTYYSEAKRQKLETQSQSNGSTTTTSVAQGAQTEVSLATTTEEVPEPTPATAAEGGDEPELPGVLA